MSYRFSIEDRSGRIRVDDKPGSVRSSRTANALEQAMRSFDNIVARWASKAPTEVTEEDRVAFLKDQGGSHDLDYVTYLKGGEVVDL